MYLYSDACNRLLAARHGYINIINMYTHVLLSLLACKYNISIHDLRNDDIHFTYYCQNYIIEIGAKLHSH
jgi:hypothetical protein